MEMCRAEITTHTLIEAVVVLMLITCSEEMDLELTQQKRTWN
jgi:hypothetical protein